METDPLEFRKYQFGANVNPNQYIQYAAQGANPEAYRQQLGMLRQSAGGSGLQGLYGHPGGALEDKIQSLREQRLGDIQGSADRNTLFESAERTGQIQNLYSQKQALDFQEYLRKEQERAAQDAKRRALASGVLGLGGAVVGGMVGGGPAGAYVGGGLGTMAGSYV